MWRFLLGLLIGCSATWGVMTFLAPPPEAAAYVETADGDKRLKDLMDSRANMDEQGFVPVAEPENVCVIGWGFFHDKGYCGDLIEASATRIRIRITSVDSILAGGRRHPCNADTPLRSLEAGVVVEVRPDCVGKGRF